MFKTIAGLMTAALLFVPTAATAAAVETAKQPTNTRLVWNDRILLRVEGGECEANGFTSPSYNLYIVPTLIKVGKTWVSGENTEVRVLIDNGGVTCV